MCVAAGTCARGKHVRVSWNGGTKVLRSKMAKLSRTARDPQDRRTPKRWRAAANHEFVNFFRYSRWGFPKEGIDAIL
jgi:hypothetical protein